MSTPKSTHVVRVRGEALTALDVPASILALMSRGKVTLSGEFGRPERDKLADLLDVADVATLPTLAELLRSDRPIRVDSVQGSYRIEEA